MSQLLSGVDPLMARQVRVLSEALLAVCALIRPLLGVCLQTAGVGEGFHTLAALERPLPSVHAHMLHQMGFVAEALLAVRALIRLLPGVDSPVNIQIPFGAETLVALAAVERLFSGVRLHVNSQT